MHRELIGGAFVCALASFTLGCSTLEPKMTVAECNNDAECTNDQVCAFGVCRDGSGAPPARYLGFDIAEVAGAGGAVFRVEQAACDAEVSQALVFPRNQVAQTLELRVFSQEPLDPLAPTLEELLPATFVVTAPSRFAREAPRRSVQHPTLADEGESIAPTTISWPRYHLDNDLPEQLAERATLLWELQPAAPEDGLNPLASRLLVLAPPVGVQAPVEESGFPNTCQRDDLECCQIGESCDDDDVANACVEALGVCRPVSNPRTPYDHLYDADCSRVIDGQVVQVDAELNNTGPVAGARVTVRHADTPGEDRLGLARLDSTPVADRPQECTQTEDCLADAQFCNTETGQCEVALSGLQAWSGSSYDPADGPPPGGVPREAGDFAANVFTYCAATSTPLTRSYGITVTPPEESALPTMTYEVDVAFAPIQAGQKKDADLAGKALCVPDWGEPTSVRLSLRGDPVALVQDTSSYTCCDLDCLPRTRADAMMQPADSPGRCNGTSGETTPVVRAETSFVLEAEQALQWLSEDSGCVAPTTGPTGTTGFLRRTAACSDDEDTCQLDFVAGDATAPRTYVLRVEPPTGSVLGSVETQISVGTPSDDPIFVNLPPRTLVRGFVSLDADTCDEMEEADGDCGSEGASVLAERLRMPGESASNTLGPYFHEVSTFHAPDDGNGRDGAYVLPLDPGVWVLTALPNSGTEGGPAPISVLDLRDIEDDVVERNFRLNTGILVTLDIGAFDRRAQVVPLDIGSWVFDGLVHPARADEQNGARLVDLGAPGECLNAGEVGTALGCRIRRLIGGTSLPPTQVGQVRFTARDLKGLEARDCSSAGQ